MSLPEFFERLIQKLKESGLTPEFTEKWSSNVPLLQHLDLLLQCAKSDRKYWPGQKSSIKGSWSYVVSKMPKHFWTEFKDDPRLKHELEEFLRPLKPKD